MAEKTIAQHAARAFRDRPVFLDDAEEEAMREERFTESTLEYHKRQGLELAVKARWVAMTVLGVFLLFVVPWPEVIYYEIILLLICVNGWFVQRMGRVGRSRAELGLIFFDLILMTLGMIGPNPIGDEAWPQAMRYEFGNFSVFYLILAVGTLAYSWRTVIAFGVWVTVVWSVGLGLSLWLTEPDPGLTAAVLAAIPDQVELAHTIDPNNFNIDRRIYEVVIFGLVAVTLGLTVRRFNVLLRSNAALERERTNLSRYFSPNVVEELSQNDEPLKQIRSHDVAVLFVDIVGFTEFAAQRRPEEVIETLREFHGIMEKAVFANNGTLDKYLGDGLMATFGTPNPSEHDAKNALRCAHEMMIGVDVWNDDRIARGQPPLRVGFGAHYGPAVLADIGANRLEFAVVGNTVNVASRLEAMTRGLNARLVISDGMRSAALREGGEDWLTGLESFADQNIRGVADKLTVWVLARPIEHAP